MLKPYPQEFRDDVVRVARQRPDGVTLDQIAADFGIHRMTLSGWMKKAAIDAGERSGVTSRSPLSYAKPRSGSGSALSP